MNWLKDNQSEVSHHITIIQSLILFNIVKQQFYDMFAKEGYTEEWYVSGMTKKVSSLYYC